MNKIFKKTLLCCSTAIVFSSVASASVVIHEQQKTPAYFQHDGVSNTQLVNDSLTTVVADEQYMILETNTVDTETGGANSHTITVFGLTTGSQDSSTVKYDVIVNDYTQDIVPSYVLGTSVTGTKLLDDAGIHIYSPSTVTLDGKELNEAIDASAGAASYNLPLIVDGESVADVEYKIEYGNNIIVTPGTNTPSYGLNQAVTPEQLFVDSGATVDSNEEVAIIGGVNTAESGSHTANLKVIGLTTGSSEDIAINYSVN
ncbi:hypothetical protein GNP81_02885 [Aliivibrio fischeri]|uniref:hypothetical protein n=1 Tax=Aliivibrio fischeri TaxID=668 RepID=UPI00105BEBA6|nr:hypothetical protein [Aliivibrio fischeri]MUK62305.1 hypothetical protein [Aliivibrio fischeri]MUK75828.1 hypothetical protein [Aliivibrio fischeri]MUL16941.1 hypothetical protein [Aliivibrio fischeri]MUL21425.1 hypothetical protein [Aliivibrio fischeri]MUL23552.1 hypothetical protein [Aliivibrio fischeri]